MTGRGLGDRVIVRGSHVHAPLVDQTPESPREEIAVPVEVRGTKLIDHEHDGEPRPLGAG